MKLFYLSFENYYFSFAIYDLFHIFLTKFHLRYLSRFETFLFGNGYIASIEISEEIIFQKNNPNILIKHFSLPRIKLISLANLFS